MSSTSEVIIRPMRTRHLADVVRIEAAVQGTPWSMDLYLDEMKAENRIYVVALAEGGTKVVGFAGCILVLDEGHISNVAVDPDWHRRGIGTQVVAAMIRGAVAAGSTAMTLEVRVSNTAARQLYQRFGFAPAGLRRRYYSDNGEDALIMWAHDVDQPDYSARLSDLAPEVEPAR